MPTTSFPSAQRMSGDPSGRQHAGRWARKRLPSALALSAALAGGACESAAIETGDSNAQGQETPEELPLITRGLVSGEHPLLVVLLEGADGTTHAHDEAWYRNRIFGGNGERNVHDFFLEASRGQFTFTEADIVTVRDDPSVNAAAGASDSDSDLTKQRKRVRYLAAQAGFSFADYDANRNKRIDNDELTVLEIDPFSASAGQYGSPGCTSLSGVSVCSGVALTGHLGSLMFYAHELAHSVGATDLYGPDGNSRHLTPMTSTPGPDTRTTAALFDPYHRKKFGWGGGELVRDLHYAGNVYKVGYLGNQIGDHETLQVTTPPDALGNQESITFEARANLSPYDDEPNVGLYAWYSELDPNGNPLNWPDGDRSVFVLAPIEDCTLHAGDPRSIGPSLPLNPGGYTWHWAGGVITFNIQRVDGGYHVSWANEEQARSCAGQGVTVWRDENFSGAQQTLNVGTWDAQALNLVGNDQITSLVVDPYFRARVCEHENAGGRCETYRGSASYAINHVGVLNDNISHIEVTPDRFVFSYAGPVEGYHCLSVNESADPDTWGDNYFCSVDDEGMQWSSAGPIEGLDCIQVIEPSDPNTWDDNYLCFGASAYAYGMEWSYGGPIPGKTCVQWIEPADPHTWGDNYLCY